MGKIEAIQQEKNRLETALRVTQSILKDEITNVRIDNYTLNDKDVNNAIIAVLKAKEIRTIANLEEVDLKLKAINLLLGEGKYKRKASVKKLMGD